jgi:hypothetical protein
MTMRLTLNVKATSQLEAGQMPSTELLAATGKSNEELVKAGMLLAGEGLHPSARRKRVHFSGSQRIATELALNHRRWRDRVRLRPCCVAISAEHQPQRRDQ